MFNFGAYTFCYPESVLFEFEKILFEINGCWIWVGLKKGLLNSGVLFVVDWLWFCCYIGLGYLETVGFV